MIDNSNETQLYIERESCIKRIQSDFNIYYPFLKIECFAGRPYSRVALLTGTDLLKTIIFNNNRRTININKKRTVAALEKDLTELLGLSVLIFRKLGNVWVETSLTEDWTLEEQNKEGEQISYHFI